MKNLSNELHTVWAAATLVGKIDAMNKLIENSHAKKETKQKALRQLHSLRLPSKIDTFASNYMLSGEGMKV